MLNQLRKQIIAKLAAAGIEVDECRREADLILEHATGLSAVEQILRADEPVAQSAAEAIDEILEQRARRVPLQYCLGQAYFGGHKFVVRPGVLIPRTDSELLVETAISRLAHLKDPVFADIGTGCGAIAISILKALSNCRAVAIDISDEAVRLTEQNARLHGVWDRLTLIKDDWAVSLPDKLCALISNPPYIPASDLDKLAPEIALWEPHLALIGRDADGMGFYRQLSQAGPGHLLAEGFVAVEVGDGQGQTIVEVFKSHRWRDVQLLSDIHKLPRVVAANRPA